MKRTLPWVLYAVVLAVAIVPVLLVDGDDFTAAWTGLYLAQLGLGLWVARPWVVVPALVTSAFLVLVSDFGPWGLLLMVAAAPCAVAAALAGWGGALVMTRWAPAAALAVFAFALAAGAGGVASAVDHANAEHVPPAVQRQLPLQLGFGNLCRDAQTPESLRRRIRREAEVLLRELDRRPDALVAYTYEYEGRAPETKDITIRRLAEQRLEELDRSQRCAPKLRQRLEQALRSRA